MLFWQGAHYIVLERIDDDIAYINDPNTGRRAISINTLTDSYSGVAIQFRPSSYFQRAKRGKLLRQSFDTILTRPLLPFLVIVAVLVISTAIVDSIGPLLIRKAIFAGKTDGHSLIDFLILLGLFRILASALQTYIQIRFSKTEAEQQSANIVMKMLRLPISFFHSRPESDLLLKSQAGEVIFQAILDLYIPTVTASLTVALYVLFATKIYPAFGLTVIIMIAASGIYFTIGSRLRREWNITNAYLSAVRYKHTRAIIQTILMLKANGEERAAFIRWSAAHDSASRFDIQLQANSATLRAIPSLLTAGTTSVVLIMCLLHPNSALFGVTMALTLIAIVNLLLSSVARITDVGDSLQNLQVSLDRHDDLISEPIQVGSKDEEPFIEPPHVELSVQDLSFGYGKEVVLNSVSFEVGLGERFAIAGTSGSGKSTLALVISGMLQPRSGVVLVGGRSVYSTGSRERFTAEVTLVEQRPAVFRGSLYDNLTMWNDSISPEDVNHVIEITRLEDLVRRGGSARDYFIEDLRTLSGGQIQRIHLARALLRKAPLLILDEATNSVDETIERRIFDYMDTMNSTIVVITHRLSALTRCQRCVLLRHGDVIESGDVHELLSCQSQLSESVRHQND